MLDFLKSTVGRKYIMGLTGLVWMGFVLGHMLGNLLILISADLYNWYGHAIVSNKPLLYGTEIVILSCLIIHVITAISLTLQNRQARQQRYAMPTSGEKAATFASKTMAIQGSLILAFIIIHLISFKYGTHYDTVVDNVPMRDIYRLVIELFKQPIYVAWYCVALICMMFHLSHGAQSVFQSFGLLQRKFQKNLKILGWLYAVIVAGGFLVQPLYVFFIYSK